MRFSLVSLLARLAVAAVFMLAAVPKIADPAAFAAAIAGYRAFPAASLHALAVFVPMLEAVGALALFWPRTRLGAGVVLGGLDVAFVVLIAVTMARGIDTTCGCFGATEEAAMVGWPLLTRDLLLLGTIVLAVWPSRSTVRPPLGSSS